MYKSIEHFQENWARPILSMNLSVHPEGVEWVVNTHYREHIIYVPCVWGVSVNSTVCARKLCNDAQSDERRAALSSSKSALCTHH